MDKNRQKQDWRQNVYERGSEGITNSHCCGDEGAPEALRSTVQWEEPSAAPVPTQEATERGSTLVHRPPLPQF